MNEELKPTLNVGLFRFCAIVLIVSWVNQFANGLSNYFSPDENSLPSSLWMFLAVIIPLALVIWALIKNSARLLKIISALGIIFYLFGFVSRIRLFFTNIQPLYQASNMSATYYVVNGVLGMVLNTALVIYIAAFFVTPKQCENSPNTSLNLPLLKVCAILFMVCGVHDIAQLILDYVNFGSKTADLTFSWFTLLIPVFSLAVGIFVLAKKNSLVLKVCALIYIVSYFWGCATAILDNLSKGLPVGIVIVNTLLSSLLVIYAAPFFVEPEKNKLYLQKVKGVFLKWKHLT